MVQPVCFTRNKACLSIILLIMTLEVSLLISSRHSALLYPCIDIMLEDEWSADYFYILTAPGRSDRMLIEKWLEF